MNKICFLVFALAFVFLASSCTNQGAQMSPPTRCEDGSQAGECIEGHPPLKCALEFETIFMDGFDNWDGGVPVGWQLSHPWIYVYDFGGVAGLTSLNDSTYMYRTVPVTPGHFYRIGGAAKTEVSPEVAAACIGNQGGIPMPCQCCDYFENPYDECILDEDGCEIAMFGGDPIPEGEECPWCQWIGRPEFPGWNWKVEIYENGSLLERLEGAETFWTTYSFEIVPSTNRLEIRLFPDDMGLNIPIGLYNQYDNVSVEEISEYINDCQECGCPEGSGCRSNGVCEALRGTKYHPVQAQ